MSDEKILCVCGSRITLRNKAVHEKTKKHLSCVEKQDILEQQTSFLPAGEKSVKSSFEAHISSELKKVNKKLDEINKKLDELDFEDLEEDELGDLEEEELVQEQVEEQKQV